MATSAVTKSLLLLRHAKSAWGLEVDDHERPLSGRGRRDGVAAGELLAKRRVRPDLVYCSTAVRARETWARLTKGGLTAEDVVYEDRIYEGEDTTLLRLLQHSPESASVVLLIGHAPGVVDLARSLGAPSSGAAAQRRMAEKYPTSGLATLAYSGPWAGLQPGAAELVGFDVPRA